MTQLFKNENFLKKILDGPSMLPVEEPKKNSNYYKNESNKIKHFLKGIVRKQSLLDKDDVNSSNSKSNKHNSSNEINESNKSNNVRKNSILVDSTEHNNSTIFNLFNKNLKDEGSILRLKEEDFRNLKKVDSVSDSETSQEILIDNINDDFVLNTNAFYYNIWETIVSMTLLYIFVFDIYIFSFFDEDYEVFTIISIVIDSIYVIDFIKCFYVPFYDQEENLIKNRKLIFYNYLQNGFLIDIVTGIPFSIFISLMNVKENTKNFKFIRIAKISRITKLTRILKLTKLVKSFRKDNSTFKLKIIEDLSINSNKKRFAKFGIYFLLFTHISSCLWVFVAKLEVPNWITMTGSEDTDNLSLYIEAFYFNLVTIFTVGYGDITPYNSIERIYNMILMIFGVLLYSFTITSLSNIVVKIEKKEKQYNKRVDFLENIRVKYNIDPSLHRILYRFLTYELQINRINKKMILDELPQQLRFSLIMQIYQKPIKILKIFDNTPSDFKLKAVTMLKQLKMLKGEYLIKSGDFLEEAYFIKKGILQIEFNVNRKKKYRLIRLYPREHFGDVYMCRNIRSPVSVYVFSKFAEMYLIDKKSFISLHEEFPDIIQKLIKVSLHNTTQIEMKAKELIIKYHSDTPINHKLMDKSKTFMVNSMMENSSPINSLISKYNNSPDRIRLNNDITDDASHHFQLIDFNTKKPTILQKHSSSAVDDSSSEVSSIRDNGTIQSESEYSSSHNNSKPHINISYNINIQNNVNISSQDLTNIIKDNQSENKSKKDSNIHKNNFIGSKDTVLNLIKPEKMLQDLKDMTKDLEKESNEQFNKTDSFKPNEGKERISILKGTDTETSINKRVSVTNNSTTKTGSKRFTIDSSNHDKTHISEQLDKVNRNSVFNNLFTDKSKRRLTKIITPINISEKRSNSVLDISKKKKSIVKIDPIIEEKKKSDSPIKRMRKLSESHYNEILSNMKKDAFVFLNPLSILNTDRGPSSSVYIEKQVDRVIEIYEIIMKSVIKHKVKY
jgi:hypothetical protein